MDDLREELTRDLNAAAPTGITKYNKAGIVSRLLATGWTRHAIQLRIAEEAGYERGLQDARAEADLLTQKPPSEAASIKPVDMRAVVEALGFKPDNHHNVLHCPYCNFGKPAHAPAVQDQQLSETALKAARNALVQERMKRLERLWRGDKTLGDASEYMADARVALEAYFAALRIQGGE